MSVLELTRRCNLKCLHCYIDQPKTYKNELSTAEIKSIISQLAKAGSMSLIFTGGEVFLRDDILELCSFARSLGFDLRIFTNGTLIDGNIAAGLAKIGISGIEISLYGKRQTHDKITGVTGSFKKAMKAINVFKEHGVRVTVKCPITKMNFSDYKWIASFAKRNKIKFRFDPTISPKDSGNKSILKFRLSSSQMKTLYKDPMFNLKDRRADVEPDLSCSAGVNMLSVGYDGCVYPCLQFLTPLGNLRKQKLNQIWSNSNSQLQSIRKMTIDKLTKCRSCKFAILCQRCPGIAKLEDDTATGPSNIACRTAKIQHSILNDFQ